MRNSKRKGFGWKRWSKRRLYGTLGLFDDYRVRPHIPQQKALPV
jgi:RNA-directed DNA polymerase